MKRFKLLMIIYALTAVAFSQQAAPPQADSRVVGRFYASQYAYGVAPNNIAPFVVDVGNAATGSSTITLRHGATTLPDGRTIYPFNVNAPITVDVGSNAETVTPTAVSGCTSTTDYVLSCVITASFSNLHPKGVPIASGTAGLQEAINDAFLSGGGMVNVDNSWAVLGGTSALLNAAAPYSSVTIEDTRANQVQYWNITPSTASFLAVPTTLTAVTAAPSATPVGAYGTGTYHLCISYVDLMGNEGACSLDFSEAGLATGSFIFTAPAASTGAVGYTIYISLTSGTYSLSYKVPLTSTICALTTVETITAACKVTNALYGQTGATATVTAITVNTAMLAPQLGVVSATTDYVSNSNARTTYAYVPGSRVGAAGIVAISPAFTITTAAATTVPNVLGSITLPAGFMNYVGRTIRICGSATEASAGSTSTVTQIQFLWAAAGSNTTGAGVILGGPKVTSTLVTSNADFWTWCQDLTTTVAGAGVTAGSIQATDGFLSESYGLGVAGVGSTGPTLVAAAIGSLNLAGEARIDVVYLHTTGTDGAGITTYNLTAQVIN